MTETQTKPQRTIFSPANQLKDEVKALCQEIHPGAFSFSRWYTNGTSLWLESSSGSRLMTVDFTKGVVENLRGVLPYEAAMSTNERVADQSIRPVPRSGDRDKAVGRAHGEQGHEVSEDSGLSPVVGGTDGTFAPRAVSGHDSVGTLMIVTLPGVPVHPYGQPKRFRLPRLHEFVRALGRVGRGS